MTSPSPKRIPELEPFFERDDPSSGDLGDFVAGLVEPDLDRRLVAIALDRAMVEEVVFNTTDFSAHIFSDGSIQTRPGYLHREPLDALVALTLNRLRNKPNNGEDGVLAHLCLMRDRLRHSLALVEAEVALRESGAWKPGRRAFAQGMDDRAKE